VRRVIITPDLLARLAIYLIDRMAKVARYEDGAEGVDDGSDSESEGPDEYESEGLERDVSPSHGDQDFNPSAEAQADTDAGE
jgi:hypothetical protein